MNPYAQIATNLMFGAAALSGWIFLGRRPIRSWIRERREHRHATMVAAAEAERRARMGRVQLPRDTDIAVPVSASATDTLPRCEISTP
jgi:hypothetical protein